jgi:hypothetical protein
MEQNTNTTAPRYWDGQSSIFMEAADGSVHILPESGCPVAIAERKWEEGRR